MSLGTSNKLLDRDDEAYLSLDPDGLPKLFPQLALVKLSHVSRPLENGGAPRRSTRDSRHLSESKLVGS